MCTRAIDRTNVAFVRLDFRMNGREGRTRNFFIKEMWEKATLETPDRCKDKNTNEIFVNYNNIYLIGVCNTSFCVFLFLYIYLYIRHY